MKNSYRKATVILILAALIISMLSGCAGGGNLGTHRAERKAKRMGTVSDRGEAASATDEQAGGTESSAPLEGAGLYALNSMEVSGMNLDPDTLRMAGLLPENNFIRLNGDGTGLMCFEGNTTEFTWTPGIISLKTETIAYVINGEELSAEFSDALLGGSLGGDAKITYILQNESGNTGVAMEEGIAVADAPQVDSKLSAAAEPYEGDWIGALTVLNGKGAYSSVNNTTLNLSARFAFDENGNCTPMIAVDMGTTGQTGFESLAAELDSDLGTMFLEGSFMGTEFHYATMVKSGEAPANIHIYLDNQTDAAEININLRRFPDTWSDTDTPAPTEEFLTTYAGSDARKVAEDMGTAASSIPSETNISGRS